MNVICGSSDDTRMILVFQNTIRLVSKVLGRIFPVKTKIMKIMNIMSIDKIMKDRAGARAEGRRRRRGGDPPLHDDARGRAAERVRHHELDPRRLQSRPEYPLRVHGAPPPHEAVARVGLRAIPRGPARRGCEPPPRGGSGDAPRDSGPAPGRGREPDAALPDRPVEPELAQRVNRPLVNVRKYPI